MCLLRKITYGEFSEFIQEKKVHISYIQRMRIALFSKNLTRLQYSMYVLLWIVTIYCFHLGHLSILSKYYKRMMQVVTLPPPSPKCSKLCIPISTLPLLTTLLCLMPSFILLYVLRCCCCIYIFPLFLALTYQFF